MLHFSIPLKLDNWGKMTTASSKSRGGNVCFVWTPAPASPRLLTFCSTKGSKERINNNSTTPLLLPSSSSSPISHSSPWETICSVTTATAQDKWLFCGNWRYWDQRETPMNMFYTSLSASVPCFLYIIAGANVQNWKSQRDETATILHLISGFQSRFDFCRQRNYRQCNILASFIEFLPLFSYVRSFSSPLFIWLILSEL